MTPRRLDLGQVLLVAAATTGVETRSLLADADITLLALITQRTREATTTARAAAEMLVGVVAGRPFPSHNHAIGWALTAHVADVHRYRLDVAPTAAGEIVRGAAVGSLDEVAVSALLAPALHRRDPLGDALVRWFAPPERRLDEVVWACPRCSRPVPESPYRSSILVVTPAPADVVTDCARRHGAHGPAGTVRRYEPVRPFSPDRELTPSGA